MIKFEGCKKHADSVQIDTIICKVMEQEDERQRDRQYDGGSGEEGKKGKGRLSLIVKCGIRVMGIRINKSFE